MIIGTAGHIDHGKTTLVRALTGVDTDRLKEEKARGISIELGYAYAPLPPVAAGGGQGAAGMLSIIDVPGHEKFVHTMAAGAAGIDHVLLVVAADDGVMPHAVPLQGDRVAPGVEARVQLVFDKPVFVVPGDRLILRNAQGTHTVGGGVVLDSLAPERRRRGAERMQWLDAMETLVAEGDARPLLAVAPAGLLRSHLARLLGRWPEPGWAGGDALAFALGKGASVPGAGADAAGDMLWLAPAAWAAVCACITDTLARHHARAPDDPGLNSASLQRMAFPAQGAAQASFARLHPQGWQAWIDRLLADGTLERTGHWLHLPSHRVTLNDAERALAERLLRLLQAGGNDPPWVRDLARDTGVREDAVRDLLRKQARVGALYQVVKDLFYPAERMAGLAHSFATLTGPADPVVHAQPASAGRGEQAPGLAAQARRRLPPGAVEARAFRDAVQLGRKRAVQILEFFDRVGYTRRVGDAHLVRPNTRWTQEGPLSGT